MNLQSMYRKTQTGEKKFEVKKEKPSALIGTSQQLHGFLRTGFSQS